MASAVVGALRVILSADTAEFKSGLDQATKLTGQFSGKLTGLSAQIQGFSKVFGTMFTVGAISAAAAKVLDYAGKIQDLADQTGLTAESLQEMDFAAKQTGKSLEGFTNAAFKLGTNLAEGTMKIQGAVEALGLSYTALKAASPDEQFRQTAIALSKMENIQERNRLGVILMGKGYKETAAAINEGYDQLADKANKASAEQIKALAEAGDKWDSFKDKLLNIGVRLGASFADAMDANIEAFKQDAEFLNKYVGIVRLTQQAVEDWKSIFQIAAEGPPIFEAALKKNLPATLANQTLSMDEAEAKAKELDAQIEKLIKTNTEAAKAADEFARALKSLGGSDAAAGAKEVLKQLEALGGPLKVLPDQLEGMADKLREGAQAALLMGDADLAGQYTKLADTLSPIIQFQQRFNVTIGEYAFETKTAAEMTEDLWEQLHRLTGEVITIGPLLENKMILPWVKFKEAVKKDEKEVEGSFQNIGDAVKNLGNTILQAVQGGGSVLGSIGSSLGMAIGQDLQKSLGKFLTKHLGKTLGDAVGAVLPGLGALIGPALELLAKGFKKLFGIGINDEIKKFNKEIEASKDKLIATYGSFERIDRLGKAVGVDLAAAWKSQGEAGKKHFEQLARDFEAAVKKMEAELEGLQGELSDTYDEARELGYIFDKDGQLVEVSFEAMQRKAQEFGVDLNALGPAFNSQKITADAKGIIGAFDLLTKGGASIGTVLFGLKDEISKLVQDSIKFGTTIPENMKPWIQNLIDTHQLLDENGKEITDIGTIKFGPAVETQFEAISRKIGDLITKIGELVTILTDHFTPALDDATRDRNVHIGVTTDPIPNVGGDGGDTPQFSTGTMGQTGRWFGNFGSGMGATLHGVEAVIRKDQAVPFAMDVMSGLSAGAQQAAAPVASRPIQLHALIENHFSIDGTEIKTITKRTVINALDNNEDGFRTDVRGLVGVTG